MSSSLEERSDKENQRNLERFTPLFYQLKKSGESSSGNHSMKCQIIGQEVGAYPFPKGARQSRNDNLNSEANPDSRNDLPPCNLLS